MHGGGRLQADATVPVAMVVMLEERREYSAAVVKAVEPVGERRRILQRFEQALAEGVVVALLRPAEAGLDTQVGEFFGQGPGSHRRPPIRMQCDLVGRKVFAHRDLFDEVASQRAGLAGAEHPAHDITAEDVDDDIQIEVRPLRRRLEFGDIPRPDVVGRLGAVGSDGRSEVAA